MICFKATRRALSTTSPAASKQLTVRDALNMALDEELARDEKVTLNYSVFHTVLSSYYCDFYGGHIT